MNNKSEKPHPDVAAVFFHALTAKDSPAQKNATRECQHPTTPFKINDEDWRYGIGLN